MMLSYQQTPLKREFTSRNFCQVFKPNIQKPIEKGSETRRVTTHLALEDGCGCTVSSYRPPQQTCWTGSPLRPLPSLPHLPSPSPAPIGWDSLPTVNQPVSCRASSLSFFLLLLFLFLEEEMISQAESPATVQVKTDGVPKPSLVRWGLILELQLRGRTLEAKTTKTATTKQLFFLDRLYLRKMSAEQGDTARDSTCQGGAAVFFSNPLMSGESLLAAHAAFDCLPQFHHDF